MMDKSDNHSVAYCLLGYLCGYFRHYYPMEFITAFLNNAQNDDDISNGTELMKVYGVKIANPKWGVSRGGYFFGRENKTVYKGMSSIKYIGEAVSNELFELSQSKHYTYFMELLADMEAHTSLDSRQLDLLIKIDFFKEFGNQRELFRIVEMFNMFKKGQAKQIKKTLVDGTPLEPIVKKYAVGVTRSGGEAKSYTLLDVISILRSPITMIGKEAGICWGADVTDNHKNYKRGLECLENEHGRTSEFPDIYTVLNGYSARVIREWYTHIGGAPTRLQASTRYIDYEHGFGYVTPPSIAGNNEASAVYVDLMHYISASLQKLDELKIPREDSAFGLPLGMETKMVDKRNLRNLIDMSHQRMCTRAYHEYRGLFADYRAALSEYSDEWKYIVDNYLMPKCKYMGFCKERYTCGMMPRREAVTHG